MVISLSQQYLRPYVSFARFNGQKQIWPFPHSIQFCSKKNPKQLWDLSMVMLRHIFWLRQSPASISLNIESYHRYLWTPLDRPFTETDPRHLQPTSICLKSHRLYQKLQGEKWINSMHIHWVMSSFSLPGSKVMFHQFSTPWKTQMSICLRIILNQTITQLKLHR